MLSQLIACALLSQAATIPPRPVDSGQARPADSGQARPGASEQARPAAKTDGQPGAKPPAASLVEAYYQFMLGRLHESEGAIDEAIKAYRAASAADPTSAEIRAELGALFARQDRAREAIDESEAAIALDPGNLEAHRVLGLIHAALARPDDPRSAQDPEAKEHVQQAITHLEKLASDSPVPPDPASRLMLARLYVATLAHAKAVPILTLLADELGDAPDVVGLLADAYAGAGRLDEAVKTLEGPAAGRPAFYSAIGELYERARRYKEAAQAYEKAVAAFPRDVDLRTRLAMALLNDPNAADASRARAVLEEAATLSPADGRVLYLLSEAQRLVKDLPAAEATARRMIASQPANLLGPLALAEVLSERHDSQALVEAIEPVAAKFTAPSPENARQLQPLLTQLGFAYQELGRYDQAIATFERVRQMLPDAAGPEVFVAQAYLAARRFADGASRARAARARFPDDPRLVRIEADGLRQSGRVDEGQALLETAVKAKPGDLTSRLALAEYLMNAKRYPAAEQALAEARAAFPDAVDPVFQLGAVYERQKRFADAEKMFRQVIAREPAHVLALNYLGYMMADRGDRLDEAVALIRKALDGDPENSSILDSLGWALFKKNQLDEAEKLLTRAASREPRNSTIQDHLGDLFYKRSRFTEAVAAWQRALDGDGEDLDRSRVEQKMADARSKTGPR